VLGDYSGAVVAWEELLTSTSDADDALFADVERVRFLDGSFSEMEDTYQRFLEKAPGHEAASFGLARFLRRKGQIGSALDVCQRALGARPDSEALRVLHLALLLQSDRAGEAEAVLNDWIAASHGPSPRSSPELSEEEAELS
jgi:tetratricopeptide (TPR) repeat protein